MIDRHDLETRNATVNAFVEWAETFAFQASAFQDGPLAGVRVGVKANIAVQGLSWTGGLAHLRNNQAHVDAEVVARLRNGGAAILGTLNMHEAALGATTNNPFYGCTINPHRAGFTPGGSSGGSGAAVAAGLCDVALGTDTLGSIRIPAAYCGTYGLKPTLGAVPVGGLLFLEPAFDVIGPLAMDLALLERAWGVMAPDASADKRPFARMLVLGQLGGVTCEPAVLAAYARALAAVALPTVPLSIPAALPAVRFRTAFPTFLFLRTLDSRSPGGSFSTLCSTIWAFPTRAALWWWATPRAPTSWGPRTPAWTPSGITPRAAPPVPICPRC